VAEVYGRSPFDESGRVDLKQEAVSEAGDLYIPLPKGNCSTQSFNPGTWTPARLEREGILGVVL